MDVTYLKNEIWIPITVLHTFGRPGSEGGGTWIWKWRTCLPENTKVWLGHSVKDFVEKRVIRAWTPKNGSFKNVQKCNFKPEFADFMLKLPPKFQIFQNAPEARENLQFVGLRKIWYKSEKGGYWVWTAEKKNNNNNNQFCYHPLRRFNASITCDPRHYQDRALRAFCSEMELIQPESYQDGCTFHHANGSSSQIDYFLIERKHSDVISCDFLMIAHASNTSDHTTLLANSTSRKLICIGIWRKKIKLKLP